MLREKKKFKNDEVDMNKSELKELMQVENKIKIIKMIIIMMIIMIIKRI